MTNDNDLGMIAGLLIPLFLYFIIYIFIKLKNKKEVKVIENVTYPEEKQTESSDKGTDNRTNIRTAADNDSTTRVKDDKINRRNAGRGKVQNKSIKHSKHSNRRIKGNKSSGKSFSRAVARIKRIEE